MTSATTGTEQQTATAQHRDSLRLIPPLAEEFHLYGGAGTIERACQWALTSRYLLADGIPACAHGLYLLASCPHGSCRTHFRQLDHASIWVPAATPGDSRPFLLSHPYSKAIRAETRAYADAHGLEIRNEPWSGDGWYGHHTIPIRMELPGNWPLWPIEAASLILLGTQPVEWPDV